MRHAMFIFFAILLSGTTLSTIKHVDDEGKRAPEHVGVEAELEPYVKNYLELASKHSIKFTNSVTVGMAKITNVSKDPGHKTIGLCSFGPRWREIDIDKDFYKNASPERRKMLLFHELTHCYCTRGHDYGDGESYLPPDLEKILTSFGSRPFYVRKPGYYLDECPTSIMHPVIVEEQCIQDHADDYIEEMFNRCRPF